MEAAVVKKSLKNDVILDELNRLKRDDGRVYPEDVVESARPETSPLHKYFLWDDDEAAEKYRLWQARQLISITVIYPDSNPIRAYLHVRDDRKTGGGYTPVITVLSDEEKRGKALADAYRDWKTFELKYQRLEELAPLFERARQMFKAMGLA